VYHNVFLNDPYNRGDHLKVARPGSALIHEGIYVGDGLLIHIESGGVGEIVEFERFTRGALPSLASRAQTADEGELRVARAIRRLGQPYHPVFFNCQHLANEAVTGTSYSQAVAGVTILGLLVLGMIGGAWGGRGIPG
jgi:hypothetical protein